MTITCNLTNADYSAFRFHAMFRYRKIHWVYGTLLAILLWQTWSGAKPEKSLADKIYLLIATAFMFVGLVVAFLFLFSLFRRFTGTRFRGTTGEHVFEISDEGVTESNANGKIETRLAAIRRVDET